MAAQIEVPTRVRRVAARRPGGDRWLEELPAVLARLADRWSIAIGKAFGAGTAAYVCAATQSDGTPCVLKVSVPSEPGEEEVFARSVLAHRLAAGRGCVTLLDHDDASEALLLERLGPTLHEIGIPLHAVLRTLATTLRELWRPLPADTELPTGAERAQWLARCIVRDWDALGRPCDRAVIDRALALCDEQATAFDPTTAVLVHGDAHGWNALETPGGGCKLVDIEGVRSHPANDLAVPMREYNEPLLEGDTGRLVRERAELLGGWCDVDPQLVWEWGYIERVAVGLANLGAFANEGGGAMALEVARRSH